MFDELIAANERYAQHFAKGDLPTPPRLRLVVLTCMDARIDPLRALGLAEGDAHILRNAGGRVTDDVLRSLVVSQQLLGTRRIAVVHHTECGLVGRTNEQIRARVRPTLGTAADTIEFLPFYDLETSVRDDLASLRASPLIPK